MQEEKITPMMPHYYPKENIIFGVQGIERMVMRISEVQMKPPFRRIGLPLGFSAVLRLGRMREMMRPQRNG